MLGIIIFIVILSIIAILAEMVLPGGILGIAGAIGLVIAVIMIYAEYGAIIGLIATIAVAVFGGTVFWFWMKYFHRLPFTRKMVHHAEVGDDEVLAEIQSMKGKDGKALTDLRPSGRALIGGERVDVIAESGFLEKESPIRVVGTSGASLVVRAIEPAGDSSGV